MPIKISIIVPVYNASKYVRRCILSLLSQTLEEIEIIIVDDKGSDDSMLIIRELLSGHLRSDIVKILEMPKNSGAAAARNYGLQEAQGEYIAFVDSDDYCEAEMYEKLYQAAKTNNSDWCYANAIKEYENGRQKILQQPKIIAGEMQSEKRKKILTSFIAYFWTSIFKRDFLKANNIKFPLYKFSEDSFFVWMVVMHAQKFSLFEGNFYHYIVQENSVSNIKDDSKSIQKVNVFTELIEKLKSENLYEEYKEELDYLYIKKAFFIPLFIIAIQNKKYKFEKNETIFLSMQKIIPQIKKNKYFKKNIKLRILYFWIKYFPRISNKIIRIYARQNAEVF